MFKKMLFTICIILSNLASFLYAGAEVRRITPPKLSTGYLGQKVLCHRPMRMGSPKVSVEQRYGKIIVNNYGHGGGGWTLAPGSADYANDLLLNSEYVKDLTENTPITVLGAGVIGLFAAYDLITKGYKNLTIVAESVDAQTSHTSGGLIAPVSMDNDNKIKKIVYKIAFKAYSFYKVIAEKKHPHFKEGAIILSAYFERRGDSGLEPYVGVVMEPAKDVILDFGNGTTRPMVAYDDGVLLILIKCWQQLQII